MSHKAERILRVFAKRLTTVPMAVPELVCGLALHLQSSKQVRQLHASIAWLVTCLMDRLLGSMLVVSLLLFLSCFCFHYS